MTVFDLICKWTPEQRTELGDFIKECMQRESNIAVNRQLSLQGLKRLHDHLIGGLVEKTVTKWYSA